MFTYKMCENRHRVKQFVTRKNFHISEIKKSSNQERTKAKHDVNGMLENLSRYRYQ